MIEDTTALARRLAEALRDLSSWVVMVSAPVSIRTKKASKS